VVADRVPIRTFRPSRDEIIGGWRSMYKEELRNLYYSQNIIRITKSRRLRRGRHVARMEQEVTAYVLVGKREGNRPVGRPRPTWENNIEKGP
jgi:hypothetical protein